MKKGKLLILSLVLGAGLCFGCSTNPSTSDSGSTSDEPVVCDHSFGDWTDCKDGANHKHVCSNCGLPVTEAHTWDAGAVTKEASHTEKGVKTFTCTACGATKTEEIGFTEGHTYSGQWEYFSSDLHTKTCDCGDAIFEAHTWDDGEITKDATPEEPGVIRYICGVCGATYEDSYSLNRVETDVEYLSGTTLPIVFKGDIDERIGVDGFYIMPLDYDDGYGSEWSFAHYDTITDYSNKVTLVPGVNGEGAVVIDPDFMKDFWGTTTFEIDYTDGSYQYLNATCKDLIFSSNYDNVTIAGLLNGNPWEDVIHGGSYEGTHDIKIGEGFDGNGLVVKSAVGMNVYNAWTWGEGYNIGANFLTMAAHSHPWNYYIVDANDGDMVRVTFDYKITGFEYGDVFFTFMTPEYNSDIIENNVYYDECLLHTDYFDVMSYLITDGEVHTFDSGWLPVDELLTMWRIISPAFDGSNGEMMIFDNYKVTKNVIGGDLYGFITDEKLTFTSYSKVDNVMVDGVSVPFAQIGEVVSIPTSFVRDLTPNLYTFTVSYDGIEHSFEYGIFVDEPGVLYDSTINYVDGEGSVKLSGYFGENVEVVKAIRIGDFEYDESSGNEVGVEYFDVHGNGLFIDKELLAQCYNGNRFVLYFNNGYVATVDLQSDIILNMDWDVVDIRYGFGTGQNGFAAQDTSLLSVEEFGIEGASLKYYPYGGIGLSSWDRFTGVQMFNYAWSTAGYYKTEYTVTADHDYFLEFDYEIVGEGTNFYFSPCATQDSNPTYIHPGETHFKYYIQGGNPLHNQPFIYSSGSWGRGAEGCYMLIDNYKLTIANVNNEVELSINYTRGQSDKVILTGAFEYNETIEYAGVTNGYEVMHKLVYAMDNFEVPVSDYYFSFAGSKLTISGELLDRLQKGTKLRIITSSGKHYLITVNSNVISSYDVDVNPQDSTTWSYYGSWNDLSSQDIGQLSIVPWGIDGASIKYCTFNAQQGHAKNDRWNGAFLFFTNCQDGNGLYYTMKVDTSRVITVEFDYEIYGSDCSYFLSGDSGNTAITYLDPNETHFYGSFEISDGAILGLFNATVGGVSADNYVIIDNYAVYENHKLGAHKFGDYEYYDNLRCGRVCEECGRVEFVAHSMIEETVVELSHEHNGIVRYTCEHCGYSYEELVEASVGHTYVRFEQCDEATHIGFCFCGEPAVFSHRMELVGSRDEGNGMKLVYACSDCGYEELRDIPEGYGILNEKVANYDFFNDNDGVYFEGAFDVNGVKLTKAVKHGTFEYETTKNSEIDLVEFEVRDNGLYLSDYLAKNLYGTTTIDLIFSNGYSATITINSNQLYLMDWDFNSVNYSFGSGANGFSAQDTSTLSIVDDGIDGGSLKYYPRSATGLGTSWNNAVQIFGFNWSNEWYYKRLEDVTANYNYFLEFNYTIVGEGTQFFFSSCPDGNNGGNAFGYYLDPECHFFSFLIEGGDPLSNQVGIRANTNGYPAGGAEGCYMLIDNYRIVRVEKSVPYSFDIDLTKGDTLALFETSEYETIEIKGTEEMFYASFQYLPNIYYDFEAEEGYVTVDEEFSSSLPSGTIIRVVLKDGSIFDYRIITNTLLNYDFDVLGGVSCLWDNRRADCMNWYCSQDCSMLFTDNISTTALDGRYGYYVPANAHQGHALGDFNGIMCVTFNYKDIYHYLTVDADTYYTVEFDYSTVGNDNVYVMGSVGASDANAIVIPNGTNLHFSKTFSGAELINNRFLAIFARSPRVNDQCLVFDNYVIRVASSVEFKTWCLDSMRAAIPDLTLYDEKDQLEITNYCDQMFNIIGSSNSEMVISAGYEAFMGKIGTWKTFAVKLAEKKTAKLATFALPKDMFVYRSEEAARIRGAFDDLTEEINTATTYEGVDNADVNAFNDLVAAQKTNAQYTISEMDKYNDPSNWGLVNEHESGYTYGDNGRFTSDGTCGYVLDSHVYKNHIETVFTLNTTATTEAAVGVFFGTKSTIGNGLDGYLVNYDWKDGEHQYFQIYYLKNYYQNVGTPVGQYIGGWVFPKNVRGTTMRFIIDGSEAFLFEESDYQANGYNGTYIYVDLSQGGSLPVYTSYQFGIISWFGSLTPFTMDISVLKTSENVDSSARAKEFIPYVVNSINNSLYGGEYLDNVVSAKETVTDVLNGTASYTEKMQAIDVFYATVAAQKTIMEAIGDDTSESLVGELVANNSSLTKEGKVISSVNVTGTTLGNKRYEDFTIVAKLGTISYFNPYSSGTLANGTGIWFGVSDVDGDNITGYCVAFYSNYNGDYWLQVYYYDGTTSHKVGGTGVALYNVDPNNVAFRISVVDNVLTIVKEADYQNGKFNNLTSFVLGSPVTPINLDQYCGGKVGIIDNFDEWTSTFEIIEFRGEDVK